ncbi:MAG TPA: hypothetical protein VM938_07245 [Acidimicrobiales bacterium]|nr:hypothetical protein [Acidimicrobiales bacterium]
MSRTRSRRVAIALGVGLAVLVVGRMLGASSSPDAGAPQVPQVPPAAVSADQPASPDGALEAGVRYATLMAELFPLEPVEAKAVVDDVASRAYVPALGAAIETELVPLQRQVAGLAGRPVYRQSVLAAKLVSHAPPRAEVSAWVMLVAGQAGVDSNAMATFSTITVGLVLEDDRWRLDRTAETPGPSPLLRDAPSTVDTLVARLDGFADWRPAT